jgi:hypothetical protein
MADRLALGVIPGTGWRARDIQMVAREASARSRGNYSGKWRLAQSALGGVGKRQARRGAHYLLLGGRTGATAHAFHIRQE